MRTNFFFGTKRTGRATAFAFGVAMIFAVVLFGLQAANPAHAVTRPPFTVNSPGDRGDQSPGDGSCFTGTFIFDVGAECTLRAAIQEANALRGADTIEFNIPGSGVHTISPNSALPPITKRVTIDGYTQGGATENTIPLVKDGTNAVLMIELLAGPTGMVPGLDLSGAGASNSVIRGLVINGFGSGIRLSGGTGYKIEGNFIGTNADGLSRTGNVSGIVIRASNSTVGGTSLAARNLISGNALDGIAVAPPGRNKIEGNLIGTNKDGTSTPNNLGNGQFGVSVNWIPIDNSVHYSTGNRILSNSIYSNGKIGIDLAGPGGADGVTDNDPDDPFTPKPDPDADSGSNNLQNFPLITSAQTIGGGSSASTSISATLESTPSTRKKKRTFIIQFFSNPSADSPSGYGEGKTFLGQVQVKTDRKGVARNANGKSPFGFKPSQTVPMGQFITATATNKRTGDTSEFSKALEVTGV